MKGCRKGHKILLLVTIYLLMTFALSGCVDSAGYNSVVDADGIEEARQAGAENGSLVEMMVALLGSRTASIQTIALLTVLSLAPSILMMLTSFTRIIIVLSFTKNAIGMQQMPPSQVIVGLALMLTFFVMAPVATQIKDEAYQPYVNGQIEIEEATDKAIIPIKTFMLKQTFTEDLAVFIEMSGQEIEAIEQVPLSIITPAFVTSEIKRGFMMGFFIYIPFIVIDMIVASVLMSMGMMMLPPTVISLPFKVLLFVVVDGWMLTVQTLVISFQGNL